MAGQLWEQKAWTQQVSVCVHVCLYYLNESPHSLCWNAILRHKLLFAVHFAPPLVLFVHFICTATLAPVSAVWCVAQCSFTLHWRETRSICSWRSVRARLFLHRLVCEWPAIQLELPACVECYTCIKRQSNRNAHKHHIPPAVDLHCYCKRWLVDSYLNLLMSAPSL